jgi:DNA-binding response OmpR family regulator
MATILLVEDAEDLARVIERKLEQAGTRMLRADDGAAGLRVFQGYQPDLVILDWMLPKMDGLAALREIRGSSPVPVLVFTARMEEADRVIGLEVGADD